MPPLLLRVLCPLPAAFLGIALLLAFIGGTAAHSLRYEDLADVAFRCEYGAVEVVGSHYAIVDGALITRRLTTFHQKFALFSDEWQTYMDLQWKALHVFHLFAEQQRFLYSIQGGSLIGYYRNGKQLFHDDDVDVVVDEAAGEVLWALWKSGGNAHLVSEGPDSSYNFEARDVEILGLVIEMLKTSGDDFRRWFKFRLYPERVLLPSKVRLLQSCLSNVGGLDIDVCKWDESQKQCVDTYGNRVRGVPVTQNLDFPSPRHSPQDMPIREFCGVKTRIATWNESRNYLKAKYPFWEAAIGPGLLSHLKKNPPNSLRMPYCVFPMAGVAFVGSFCGAICFVFACVLPKRVALKLGDNSAHAVGPFVVVGSHSSSSLRWREERMARADCSAPVDWLGD